MQIIHLSDQVYATAKRQAEDAGFDSVDEFFAHVVNERDHQEVIEDGFFTDEKLAHINRIRSEIEDGALTYTGEDVRQHFQKKWEAWHDQQAD